MNSGNRTFIPTSQSEYFSLDALRPFYALNEMRDKKDFDGLYDLFQDYQEAIGEIQYFIRWAGCGSEYCLARVLFETSLANRKDCAFIRMHSDRSYSIFCHFIEAYALRTARKALGMTQKRIAKDLRISVSTLQRYETLRLRIPESMLLDYANLLTINQLSMERPVFQALHSKRTA